MRRSTLLFAALMASIFVFYSCRNENADGQLTLLAEGMNHGGKMLVDGYSTMWASGDQVRINDETVTVSVSDGSATVSSGSKFTAPFFGVYPAGIYRSNSGASYTLNLPDTYSYAVADGKQNLASPMVAYAESGSTLMFKHLTAAIGVEVVNYYGFTISVDSIVVESDSYKLNGAVTVTLGDDIAVDTAVGSAAADRRVKMTFGDTPLQVFAGDSTVVQVPVLPVGLGNKFTVKICVHKVDQPAVAKAIEKTQSVGGSLGRSYLAYARLATPGLFSVAANKKVIISQGNLQYIGSAATPYWKFAETQYGYFGTTTGQNGTAADVDRDLFGWGTSGWSGSGATAYQPYATSTTDNQYYNGGDITNTNADWGKYNSISNGGNQSDRWFTPTSEEWDYVIIQRSVANRFVKASVAGVKGLIIFSDDYVHPEDITALSNVNDATKNYGLTYINTAWVKMEAAGAVFLPAVGYRTSGTTVSVSTPGIAYYWSSSKVSSSNKAYNVYLFATGITTQNDNYSSGFNKGYYVRLMHEI